MMTSMWPCRSIYGNFLVIVTSGSYQEEVKVERGERRQTVRSEGTFIERLLVGQLT